MFADDTMIVIIYLLIFSYSAPLIVLQTTLWRRSPPMTSGATVGEPWRSVVCFSLDNLKRSTYSWTGSVL